MRAMEKDIRNCLFFPPMAPSLPLISFSLKFKTSQAFLYKYKTPVNGRVRVARDL
jgi:hypothetical protein